MIAMNEQDFITCLSTVDPHPPVRHTPELSTGVPGPPAVTPGGFYYQVSTTGAGSSGSSDI
jgi:hypothetical protein